MTATMASQTETDSIHSPNYLTRWYMDTRNLSQTESLPLIETLQPPVQTKIRKYYNVADRQMSLASSLLKYLYIHRTCRVPWDKVVVGRTPDPHRRPCYVSTDNGDGDSTPLIEFNVSHQASLIALAGCVLPNDPEFRKTSGKISPDPNIKPTQKSPPQIGIDITCTQERSRRNTSNSPQTVAAMSSFIDIFSEAFSPREIAEMRSNPANDPNFSGSSFEGASAKSVQFRLRRFYTYWALKEAYIKMVGEGLLAPWLQELEFMDVHPPQPRRRAIHSTSNNEGKNSWGKPESDIGIFLHGDKVDGVRMETVAFEDKYIIATSARGTGFGNSPNDAQWGDFRLMDIERDIAPCALGRCTCLL